MKMYYDDFDANGSFETIVATEKEWKLLSILGMDDLAEQFSGMIKRNFHPKAFAGKQWKRYLVHRCFQMQNHLKSTI
jgi:DNA-directed RNA polymerase delta subunit